MNLCRRCGREYAEVHVEGYPVTLYGHLRPPTPSHPVRLARSASASPLGSGDDLRSEAPDTHHLPGGSDPGTSSRTSIGTRAARNGRDRTASPPVATPDVLDREGRLLTNPLSGRSLGCFPRPSLSSASRRS